MDRLPSKLSAVNLLVAGAVMISFSGIWVKLAHVQPIVSAFYRVFFGCLFLVPAAFIKGEIKPRPVKAYVIAVLSGLFFAADLFCWHESIMFIGPGLATMIGNFQVFGLTLVGILFFKERLHWLFVLALPLSMAGLYLIVGTDWQTLGPDYHTGIYYGFATAICYVGYLLTLRQLQSRGGQGSRFFYIMLVTSISTVFLAGMIFAGGHSFMIPDVQSLLVLGGLGFFSQFAGWVVIAGAMPHIKPSHTGLILLLQPTLSFVWDVLFFDRPTDLMNWAGIVLTLAAIYMGMTRR